jgi:hypothetical protein
VILADLEVWHSRYIAPTRRVALGKRHLPTDPAPGFGGLLLGGIVAARIEEIDPDLYPDLNGLIRDLQDGRRIPQPRLRYRFQVDRVGLTRSRHRLIGDGESIEFDIDDHEAPAPQVLAAVYAAGQLSADVRPSALRTVSRAVRWRGPLGPALISHLSGVDGARAWSADAFADPEAWALGVLGLYRNGRPPSKSDVLRRFRVLLREAHPDHGADHDGAGQRILDLTEARRILLSS